MAFRNLLLAFAQSILYSSIFDQEHLAHFLQSIKIHFAATSVKSINASLFQVFSSVTDSTSIQTLKTLEEGIDEICWLVCKKLYLERCHPVFDDHSVYQLFRIYCLLAETEPDATDSYLVGHYFFTIECSLWLNARFHLSYPWRR